MPVATCQACAPVSCFGQGSLIDSAQLYTLQGPAYQFVLNCPPGVDCQNAPYLLLLCCEQVVFLNLIGITGAQRTNMINRALNRCAQYQAACGQLNGDDGGGGSGGGGGGTGNPPTINYFYNTAPACCPVLCNGQFVSYCVAPGTVLSASSALQANTIAGQIACSRAAQGRVQIGNNRQCYTAACGGGDPFTATSCIEANMFGECLFFPTPEQIRNSQIAFDDEALGFAQADALGKLATHGCLVCNEELTGFVSCPGDPTKTANATVAAGTFCSPSGTDPSVPYMKAQDQLNTALHNNLAATGCSCPSPVSNRTAFTVTFTCATFLQWSFAAFGGIIGYGPGVYDAFAVASAYGGGPPTPGSIFRIHPIGWVGPDIVFTF